MGDLAIRQLKQCFKALIERDRDLAKQVIDQDAAIDGLEHTIDTFVIRMIALRQPVAGDLRQVISALKIASHLERIADYGTNIARRVLTLMDAPKIPSTSLLTKMVEMTCGMIESILDAYKRGDEDAAIAIWHQDQDVDALYTSYLRELLTYMMEDPRNISPCTELLFAAKNVERAGDHVANIAEIIYYMVRGIPFDEQSIDK